MISIRQSPTADTRTCDFAKVTKETLLASSKQHIRDGDALEAAPGAPDGGVLVSAWNPQADVKHLRERAAWYLDGCDGLENQTSYLLDELAEDAGNDLTSALDMLEIALKGPAPDARDVEDALQ